MLIVYLKFLVEKVKILNDFFNIIVSNILIYIYQYNENNVTINKFNFSYVGAIYNFFIHFRMN